MRLRRDGPQSVRTFLRLHRVQGELHYLIGSEQRLRPVWRAFHVLSARSIQVTQTRTPLLFRSSIVAGGGWRHFTRRRPDSD
jgi:hypothetical protein